jgi:hypothetical protein
MHAILIRESSSLYCEDNTEILCTIQTLISESCGTDRRLGVTSDRENESFSQ